MSRVLVVDDQPNVLTSFEKLLRKRGHEVLTAPSGEAALEAVRGAAVDLVLMDIRMAGLGGLETFRRLRQFTHDVPVIMMTAYGTTETAIEAMKLGAFEYVLKPFDLPALETLIEKALVSGRFLRTPAAGEDAGAEQGERIIGQSQPMIEVYKRIGQVALSPVTVLIRGESGTGKELIARAIHRHGPRAQQPFVAVNCAAIPETLLESELFGYERGAFTGAAARRPGKFEQANNGTIFLDEIGDMTPSTQAKVLRVLQEQTCERLGGQEAIRLDVRVLAATNKDLERQVAQGRFRDDLYYRLNVVTVALPALRDRREDIPQLVGYFLARHARQLGKLPMRLTPEALERLSHYDWPGNVRELENCLKQASILAPGGVILPDHLRLPSGPTGSAGSDQPPEHGLRPFARAHLANAPGEAFAQFVEQAEAQVILEALEQTQGNLTKASRLLGISRVTLREKVLRYHIHRKVSLAQEEREGLPV